MTKILYGKHVKEKIEAEILQKVSLLKEKGIKPTIGIVRVGENPSDISYERGIRKNAENFNIEVVTTELSIDADEDSIIKAIKTFNVDSSIGGILLFKPLPKGLNEDLINESINPKKDVDCIHPTNLAKIFMGSESSFIPCTPLSAIKIMEGHNIDLEGKKVVVINRSLTVGKPLSMLLLNRNATVTIAHSKTENLKGLCKDADIICIATGKSEFLDENYVSRESVVIDIGVSMNKEGKMRGDADFDSLNGFISAITPVPGGVGSITNMLLIKQSLNYFNI